MGTLAAGVAMLAEGAGHLSGSRPSYGDYARDVFDRRMLRTYQRSSSSPVSCNCQSLLLDLEFISTLLWSAMSLCQIK